MILQAGLALDIGMQACPPRRTKRVEIDALAERLKGHELDFVIPPSVRFEGEPGEQATMFLRDPSGNPIEVKACSDLDKVYAT